MPKKTLNLPLSFSISEFDSDRFLKLRVKVMHSGLNLNNSSFGMQSIEKAQPTIANIPLLAFIKKEDGSSNEDFAGHEFEIKITESGMKYVYLGRPIGIVPETNNYTVEVDAETGKTFVEVDAYVWKNYANSALDIIESSGVKRVSMEIAVHDYSFEDSYFDVLDYSYTGIAILGDGVQEAMIGAKAEVANFSETKSAISELMFELKKELQAEEIVDESAELVETEMEVQTEMEVEAETADEVEAEIEVQTEMEAETQMQTQIVDEVETADQDTQEFEVELLEDESTEFQVAEETDTQENATQTTEEFEAEETVENAEVQEFAEVQVDSAEVIELKSLNASLQAQNADLLAKIKEYEVQAIEEEFSDISDLTEYSTIVNSDLEIEEIKTQLFALRGKNVKTNANPLHGLVFNYMSTKEDQSSGPSWAHLVTKSK